MRCFVPGVELYVCFERRLVPVLVIVFIWIFFLSPPKDLGWIIIPPQSCYYDNLPCHTINQVHRYPPEEQWTLVEFGKLLGFVKVEDHDDVGRNVFHHLFLCCKYCWLAGFIAMNCFTDNAVKMPGNYRKALRQHTFFNGAVPRVTPLHILCKDSDSCLLNLKIVEKMCFHHFAGMKNFETLSHSNGGQVIVLFMFTHCLTLDALFLKLKLR